MRAAIECEGAPRDLGLDQGRACRSLLRARLADAGPLGRLALLLFRLDPAGSGLDRELARQFPRQAEALEGLATGAGVPRLWLLRQLAHELIAEGGGEAGVAVCRDLTASGAWLARVVSGDWIVRRSRPDGGFRSLAVSRPWLTHALAGVNERGLAAAVVSPECERLPTPPAALLVEDCLQRFESLDGALDWCHARPGEGPATLLLGDARGEVAGVEYAGGPGERRVLRPGDGLVLALPDGAGQAELAKALRASAPLDGAALARALAPGGGPRVLSVDCSRRRLGLAGAAWDC